MSPRPDIPAVPVVAAAPLRSLSERLAHPLMGQALRDAADAAGVCRHPQVLRSANEATGRAELALIPCGATQERKCPACARAGKRLRQEQARAGWHLEDEPAPEPEANSDQVALLQTRALYEYLRWDCESKGEWQHVAELDEAIDECEAMMRVSGLRGHLPSRRGEHAPDQSAAPADVDSETGPTGADPAGDSTGADNAIPAAATVDGTDTVTATVSGNAGPAPKSDEPGDATASGGPERGRRVRSTRRRQDSPDLPRLPVAKRTIGRTYTSTEGKVFRPSTFVTLTLPSYGRVNQDGSPVDPNSYDYRRAAWDAVHFPALIDRLFQNLRRTLGWNVQYFGTIEAQRRLSPHAHFAIRGAIPRATLREVIAATYRQVWWPSTATIRYPEHADQPVWDPDTNTYRDPTTGQALPTWAQALDELDEQLDAHPDRQPEHVVAFGSQMDLQGVLGGTPKADKLIGYLCKYITKSVGEAHRATTDAAVEHQRRLWQELRYTPCSPRCPNWLRYGIQPHGAKDGLKAGFCRGKVHHPDTLGLGGRRVLVSRLWSGMTLADHKYDRNKWVTNLLQVTRRADQDIDDEHAETIRQAREGLAPEPIAWDWVRPGDPGVPDRAHIQLRYIATKTRQRLQIQAAKAAAQAGADHPPADPAEEPG
jgi:hypothetical protein